MFIILYYLFLNKDKINYYLKINIQIFKVGQSRDIFNVFLY